MKWLVKSLMSFLHVFKDVGGFLLAADKLAAPIVTAIDPPVGAAMNAIAALVVGAERAFPASGSGPIKHANVKDSFLAMLPMLQQLMRQQGFEFTVDSTAVSNLIDATCAQLNAAAAFQAGFKLEKLPQ